jgi:hypothetical protein
LALPAPELAFPRQPPVEIIDDIGFVPQIFGPAKFPLGYDNLRLDRRRAAEGPASDAELGSFRKINIYLGGLRHECSSPATMYNSCGEYITHIAVNVKMYFAC